MFPNDFIQKALILKQESNVLVLSYGGNIWRFVNSSADFYSAFSNTPLKDKIDMPDLYEPGNHSMQENYANNLIFLKKFDKLKNIIPDFVSYEKINPDLSVLIITKVPGVPIRKSLLSPVELFRIYLDVFKLALEINSKLSFALLDLNCDNILVDDQSGKFYIIDFEYEDESAYEINMMTPWLGLSSDGIWTLFPCWVNSVFGLNIEKDINNFMQEAEISFEEFKKINFKTQFIGEIIIRDPFLYKIVTDLLECHKINNQPGDSFVFIKNCIDCIPRPVDDFLNIVKFDTPLINDSMIEDTGKILNKYYPRWVVTREEIIKHTKPYE